MNRSATSRPRLVRAGSLATLALGVSLSAPAGAQCLVNCDFSISGKKGRFLDKQVTSETLAKSDLAMTAGATQGLGLADVSINKGGNAGSGLRMPATERALMTIIDAIAAKWSYRSPGPVTVRITASTSFSPIAKPDNVIIVPLGLIMQAKNDDDVAWALAHEYSHIALAHFSREARQRQLTSGFDKIVACARTAMAMSELRPQKVGDKLRFTVVTDEGARSLSRQARSRGENIADLLEIYNQQLSKQQEDQADAAGLDLALKAGYSDSGFGDALVVVENEEKRYGSLMEQFTSQMSSQAKIKASASLKSLLAGGDIQETAKAFASGMLKNGLSLMRDKAMDMMKQSHRPARKRREGLNKYVETAWNDAEPVDARHGWLDGVRATPEYQEAKTAVQSLDNTEAAMADIGVGDPAKDTYEAQQAAALAKAIAAIQPALKTRYSQTPIVANTIAGLMVLAHRAADADRFYDMAAAAPLAAAPALRTTPVRAAARRSAARGARRPAAVPPVPTPTAQTSGSTLVDTYLQQSLSGFDQNVDFLVKQRNYAKALKVIALARSRFGDDVKFLSYLITIYTQTQQKELLLATIGRCTASQDKQVQQHCMVAMYDPEQIKKIDLLPPYEQDKIYDKMNVVYDDARMGSSCGIGDLFKPKTS